MSEQRDNSGALFREANRPNERSPEYTGTVVVNGKPMRIAAWVKETKDGKKFFSLSFSEPRART
jgi:uncharacterized protein (DUF736 family)